MVCCHLQVLMESIRVFSILLIFCTILIAFLYITVNKTNIGDVPVTYVPQAYSSLPKFIVDVARSLERARIHARGIKSQTEIGNAIEKLNIYLKSQNTSFHTITKRKVYDFSYVCPEVFESIEYDFPRYEQNYKTQGCNYSKPINEYLTVALALTKETIGIVNNVVENIHKQFPDIEIVIGIGDGLSQDTRRHVNKIPFTNGISIGKIWNTLVEKSKTEYVLIGRNMINFSNDTNLYRLVREIQRLKVKVAGGSTKDEDKRWYMGCYQRAYRNFTLVYKEGYDESLHDCLFCDHIDGPFIIRTQDVKTVKFDENLGHMGVFEDFFMRLKGESVICPDSMFHVKAENKSTSASAWKSFRDKLELYKLKYSTYVDLNFGCSMSYSCPKKTGFIHSPCCLLELAKLINDVDKTCLEHNVICENNCGNLVGSIKFGHQLPWELDGDMKFYAGNYSAMKKLQNGFSKLGYTFRDVGSKNPDACPPNLKQPKRKGSFDVRSKHWTVTLYGFCYVHTQISMSQGKSLTYVRNFDRFVISPRNPALYIRNKYAIEPFAHAQHYFVTGTKFEETIKPGIFSKCKIPGAQDCLDNYNTDGNIQFQDIIP